MTNWASSRTAEGWVDKLNGRWTPWIFFVLGVTAFVGQIYFSPIECMFPPEFTPAAVEYGKARCYAAKKITAPKNSELSIPRFESKTVGPDSGGERPLYRYVSFILILQAVFLRIPFMIWKLGERRLGIHFHVSTENLGHDKSSLGRSLAVCLKNWIQNRKVHILSLGSFVIFHLFIKLLYFISASIHLGLLNGLLENESEISFGFQVWGSKFDNNSKLHTSSAFPRHIMCEYDIQFLSNKRVYTNQCTLPLNPYLEQMMAVVWCWLVVCIAFTAADGFLYFWGAVLPYFRTQFVKFNLITQDLGSSKEAVKDQNIQRFANDNLGEDIIDFLQQIQNNDNGYVVMETITELWKIHFNDTQAPPVGVRSLQPTSATSGAMGPTTPSHTETLGSPQGLGANAYPSHQALPPPVYPTIQKS